MYQLDPALAGEIVRRTIKIIGHNINVMNGQGIILGSGDPARLGQQHLGACQAIAQGEDIAIYQGCSATGVKPGLNLPLRFQGQIIGVIGITGHPDSLSQYGELLKMTAEMIVEQANLMEQLQWQNRRREEFILQLIRASAVDMAKLAHWAKQLDIDIHTPRVAAIIEMPSPRGDEMKQLMSLLQYPERDNLIAMTSLSQLVILKPAFLNGKSWSPAAEHERIEQLLTRIPGTWRQQFNIALGHFFSGDGGIARSYQTARETLAIGQHLHPGKGKYLYEDYAREVLLSELAASWRGELLCQPYEALLQADTKGILRRTLMAYLQYGAQPGPCADALFIHRNTLRYRLDKISQITGISLQSLDGLMQLQLAFWLHQTRT